MSTVRAQEQADGDQPVRSVKPEPERPERPDRRDRRERREHRERIDRRERPGVLIGRNAPTDRSAPNGRSAERPSASNGLNVPCRRPGGSSTTP
jgi:hypothetical protein